MKFQDFLARIRHLDNQISKWLMHNFYYTFFHLVIVAIFFIWCFNLISLLNVSLRIKTENPLEKIMILQSFNANIVTFLLLLNSLWILYMLNNSHRIKNSLKNISYNTAPKPFYRDNRKKVETKDKDA